MDPRKTKSRSDDGNALSRRFLASRTGPAVTIPCTAVVIMQVLSGRIFVKNWIG